MRDPHRGESGHENGGSRVEVGQVDGWDGERTGSEGRDSGCEQQGESKIHRLEFFHVFDFLWHISRLR